MSGSFHLKGARELDQALGELKKSTERTILRRVAIKALEPIRDRAMALVPVDEGRLRDSITIGTALSRSAKKAAKDDPPGGVRVYVGTAKRNAIAVEFGTFKAAAHPFMRPAFDGAGPQVFGIIETELRVAIEKNAARAARFKARG